MRTVRRFVGSVAMVSALGCAAVTSTALAHTGSPWLAFILGLVALLLVAFTTALEIITTGEEA